MATTFTSNLGLRLTSDFTSDLTFNFNKLDTLATVYQTNVAGGVTLRSKTDISIEPNSADLGAALSGGVVCIGSTGNTIDTFEVYSSAVDFKGATLSNVALDWADLTGTGITTLPVGLDDVQTLTNKTIDASLNTLTEISNSAIAAAAAIDGSKVVPTFGAQTISSSTGLSLLSTFSTTLLPASSGQIADLNFELPNADGTAGQVLSTDGAGAFYFSTVAGVGAGSQIASFTWAQADAATKNFVHNFATKNVGVTIIDETNQTIDIDSEDRINDNSITLTRQGTAGGDWTVIFFA